MNQFIMRGDLYYADLNPAIGSEQGGIRPVLILQNDIGNRHSPTVIIAAITGKAMKKILPIHHILSSLYGLERESLVLLEQIRTIDKQRLIDRVGTLSQGDMRGVDKALMISIGLNNTYAI